jgi:hypothetical protein
MTPYSYRHSASSCERAIISVMLQKYILLLRNKIDSTKLYGGTSPKIFLKFQKFKKLLQNFFGAPFFLGGLGAIAHSPLLKISKF